MVHVSVHMSDRLAVAPDLLMDRHYRGAIVMVGLKMFAVSEDSARLIERVERGEWSSLGPEERSAVSSTLDDLVARGVLRFVAESA